MILTVVGISHKTAPIELREKLSLRADSLSELFRAFKTNLGAAECVALSTCNRTEIYWVGTEDISGPQGPCAGLLQQYFGASNLSGHLYFKTQGDAIAHLFRVVSGLDSLVLGENEILKQVKEAYLAWHKLGATGKVLNVLFQRALYVGKMVRTRTAIGQGSLSVSSMAVSLAERIFGGLQSSAVLLFGAGTMAELAARQLLLKNVRQLWVANRTLENAQALARQFHAQAMTLEQGLQHLLEADIVITSMSVAQPFIRKALLQDLIARRKNRSLFIIDIALPRNVEAISHTIDNVYLYNMDDLQRLVDENVRSRRQAIDAAQTLADTRAAEFHDWFCALAAGQEKSLKHFHR